MQIPAPSPGAPGVALCVLAAMLLAAGSAAVAKTGPTLHTREEIARAREQARTTEWGREAVAALLTNAAGSYSALTVRGCAGKPDRYFWDLMPTTKIPRTYYVHDRWKEAKGCPVHGTEIFTPGSGQLGAWGFDIDHHPWKLRCPVGGEYYPSNDFAAGDLASGDHPDDGSGWRRGEDRYFFVAVYAHYLYLGNVRPTVANLAQAYLLTGDPALGRKGAILLCKIAQEYPNSTTKKDRTYHSGYASGTGMITDCDWSPSDLAALTEAYDCLYDAYDDPECIAFLSAQRPELKTAADIRAYVEQELLRAGAQACIDGPILGNHGAREFAMTRLALVLDDYSDPRPNSKDCLHWAYYRGPAQLRTMASNLLTRDGGTTESPNYNTARLETVPIMQMVERIRALHPNEIPADRYPILFQDPAYRAMFDYFTDMVCIERYVPVIGDMGGGTAARPSQTGRLHYGYLGGHALEAFRQYGDPKFAQVAHYGGFIGETPGFFADEELQARARKAALKAGPHLPPPSAAMDGYKLAILRQGRGDHQRALCSFYGDLLTHGQPDPLQIGLFAKGLDLLPGIGYPQSWKDAGLWEAHVLTHNTVCIDQANPGGDVGRLLGFVDTPLVQWMQLDKERVGPEVDTFRRTMALVRVSDEDAYAVDLFEVRGGREHHLGYHGPQAEVAAAGLEVRAQARGTLAGEDVAFGREYRDAAGRARRDPFCLMTSVQRAEPAAPWSVDYAAKDERDVHVRLHGAHDDGTEVILADGRGATHPEQYTAKFVLAHRTGQAPLSSRFLTVIEPYERTAFIKAVRRIALPAPGAVALQVDMEGATDTLVFSRDASHEVVLPGGIRVRARFAMVRQRGRMPTEGALIAGRSLAVGALSLALAQPAVAGHIAAVDRAGCTVDLDGARVDPGSLVGRAIRFHNDRRTSTYTIRGAERRGARVRVTLHCTSRIGEGAARGVDDFVIHNPVLTFYGGLTVKPDGTRARGHSLYVGATLENEAGTAAVPVEGVTGGGYSGTPGDVYVDRERAPQATASWLRTMLTDKNGDGDPAFFLYDYGVGDAYEVLNSATTRGTRPR